MVKADIDTTTGDGMIVLRPNSASSWHFNMLVVASLATIMFVISVYFLLQGLWLIMPFAGLELFVLVWALYHCMNKSIRTEVIIFDGDTVVIERGHRYAEHKWEYNRAWSKIFIKQPRIRGYMKQVFIRSYGKELELGSFLNTDDREQLIKSLKHIVYA